MNETERAVLFSDLHRSIEATADEVARMIVGAKSPDVDYPPSGGLNAEEVRALTDGGPGRLSAIRKLVADASATSVFRLFCLLDGVADPLDAPKGWRTFRLERGADPTTAAMLHDGFLESYWEWVRRRPDPGWRLDDGR